MANQDYLTFGGVGKDPSGAYSQIEAGWDPTYADGAVTWRPTSSSFATEVLDTGTVSQTYTKVPSATGWTQANPDTYQIQSLAGAAVANDYVSIVVTQNAGGSATNGTYTLASSEIASISTGGLITFASGTDVFVTTSKMVITYNADIVDIASNASEAVCVKGAKSIHVYHPASGNAEVTAKWQWTDNEDLSVDSSAQATWEDITSTTASAQAKLLLDSSVNADWTKLDKMAYIRLLATSTASATGDAVADVTAYEHASTGAYVSYSEDRSAESNAGITIGGMGSDPS